MFNQMSGYHVAPLGWHIKLTITMSNKQITDTLYQHTTKCFGGFCFIQPRRTKAMATHSSTLAWKTSWMEEPGRLQSKGSLKVGRDLSNFTFTFHFPLSCIGAGNGNPLQCSCLENPRDKGAWWASVYGVSQSRTRLKGLSSSRI